MNLLFNCSGFKNKVENCIHTYVQVPLNIDHFEVPHLLSRSYSHLKNAVILNQPYAF